MQAERDLLRNVVFPALEEKLKARRVHLEWIDLRVGVANAVADSEEAFEAQVLKVCLDEVKRSRPFLIGLLGDRYGWVPPRERAEAAVEEAAAEELERRIVAALDGRSVTDLEIDFGVLSDPEQRKRSLFWFRRALPYDVISPETAAEYNDARATDIDAPKRAQKLEALKERIRAALPNHVFDYAAEWGGRKVTGLEGWARQVEDELWKELDAETAQPRPVPTWQEEEREALLDFAEDRARDFIGRAGVLDAIIRFVASKPEETQRGLVIVGEAGSGKSALWGVLNARLSKAKGLFLLSHAAGAGPRAPSIDLMLRRWIEETAAELGTTNKLEDNAKDEEVENAFASLIGRVAQTRRVLILVDALDQFETTNRGRFITWLPKLWPENARFVATAIPGEATQALERLAGMRRLPLPQLDRDEARDIVRAICRRYHRAFEAEVIEALAGRIVAPGPAQGNALWLVLAAEALNLLDGDDFARTRTEFAHLPQARRNAALMLAMVAAMPADIPGMYGQSFDRAAKLFGERTVWSFLGAIAVSRGGWRETDFRGFLPKLTGEPWDELRFAQLRRSFRGQMRARGALAQWDFAHGQMREAFQQWAGKRALGEEKGLHTAIADHLVVTPEDDPLRLTETMLHLIEGEDGARRAALYYGDSGLNGAAENGATQVLADFILRDTSESKAAGLARVLTLLEGLDPREPLFATVAGRAAEKILFNLDERIADRVQTGLRRILFEKLQTLFAALEETDLGNAGWQYDLSVSQMKIGDALVAQGNLPDALVAFRQGHANLDRLARADPGNVSWQLELSMSQRRIGDVLVAQGNLPEALQAFLDGLATAGRLATRDDPVDAQWLVAVATSFERLGDVRIAQGNLPEAFGLFCKSYDAWDHLTKANPHDTRWQRALAVSSNKLGGVLAAQGNLQEALRLFNDSLLLRERLVHSDPMNFLWKYDLVNSNERIGDTLAIQGNLDAATKFYEERKKLISQLAQSDPGNAGWQRELSVSFDRIGDVLKARGQLAEALKSFRDGFTGADRLARSDPSNVGWQCDLAKSYHKVGEVLLEQIRLPEAFKSFRDALAIYERLAQLNPANEDWQDNLSISYHKIGEVLMMENNPPEALNWFHKGLLIRERLACSDPSNMVWQRYLSASLSVVGEALMAEGKLPEALKQFHDGLLIRQRLVASDGRNADYQHDLSKSYLVTAIAFTRLNDRARARDALQRGHDILVRLCENSLGNARAVSERSESLRDSRIT